jgi:GNAT superfamily N-acetyltransferase
MSLAIRPARPGDGAVIHAMALELARSHGHEDDFAASPEDFETALFQPGAIVGALIAELDGEAAGSAFWHRSFATFRGREVMYLEDLSVLPRFQRRGVGRALLKAVAQLAVARGYPVVAWMMMGWNDGARALYQATGAEAEDGLCLWRLHGDALRRLAA